MAHTKGKNNQDRTSPVHGFVSPNEARAPPHDGVSEHDLPKSGKYLWGIRSPAAISYYQGALTFAPRATVAIQDCFRTAFS